MVNGVALEGASTFLASFAMIRIRISTTAVESAPVTPSDSRDRVTLSPASRDPLPHALTGTPAPVANGMGQASDGAVPTTTGPSSDSPQEGVAALDPKVAALIGALDRDRDGSVSREEFVRGAAALLRQTGRRHTGAEPDGDRIEHDPPRHGHRPGLGRRLARAFRRIDGNGDGALDANELTAAISQRHTPAVGDGLTSQSGPGGMAASATASGSVVAVTVVAIAVQRYQSVSQLGPTTA